MSQLWDDKPNYASACFPPPRPFQDAAHAALRAGALEGHKNQMVMAPTGAGKSYLGLRIIHEALLKGKKAVFMCDRTTLINQTSEAADKYGLSAHGILQASHWRMNSEAPFQIASAQTIARRKWPDADVIVIDEAHTQMKAWTEYIPDCRAKVIGLSATPFSDGLGKLFTNLINATTMDELTRSGVLVPMRVLSCTMTNMAGAATAGGEWTDQAAEQRGMEIIGDVVAEWIKHAQNRKTIVFGATIKHCEELCRQFNEIGVMAAVFTSNTLPTEREFLLKEYRKQDSSLRVLVSVEALAKGFDVPDVGCLEEGSAVLTTRGLVAIEKLLLSDKIWDGVEFVSHDGPIFKGEQDVITYQGLTATEDHLVSTADGWRKFGECAAAGIAIRKTGDGDRAIRELENCFYGDSRHRSCNEEDGNVRLHDVSNNKSYLFGAPKGRASEVQGLSGNGENFTPGFGWKASGELGNCLPRCFNSAWQPRDSENGSLPMRRMLNRAKHVFGSLALRARDWLSGVPGEDNHTGMACQARKKHEGALLQAATQSIQGLRRAWNRIQVFITNGMCEVGYFGARLAPAGQTYSVGQNRQQWALRAGKSSLGNKGYECLQYPARRLGGEDSQVQDGASRNTVCGQDATKFDLTGLEFRSNNREVLPSFRQAKRRVWDVLNAGPRNRFTCEGLLVHNCVVDCRPLRKSLSTAIQMWGRGLRSSPDTGKTDCLLLDHCIATGQRVLTHRGLVCIEEILLSDKLWDGHEFVAHKGVISRGIKPVIQYAGLTATADHPVKTAQGWRTLGQCADEQARIITTGVGRTALRERDGYFTGPALAGAAGAAIRSCALRVRGLWVSLGNLAHELAGRAHEGLSSLQSAGAVSKMAVCAGAQHEAALHESEGSPVQGLRRQGDRVPFRLRDHLRTVGAGQPWHTGGAGGGGVGPQGQQWALRAGEHSVVHPAAEHEQHASQQVDSADAQIPAAASGSALRRCIAAGAAFLWSFVRGNRGAVGETFSQAEREVWDVLDCGPRNSFTCEGLLVHNSGNIQRFLEDYTTIFFDGLDALDMGEKLDKAIRRDKEDDDIKKGCPSCGYTPFYKRCMSCGYEKQTQSLQESLPGEMREIMLGKKKVADDMRNLYEQACTYARAYSAPEKQSARAYYLFKDMAGMEPPKGWTIHTTPDVQLSRNFVNRVKAKNIAYQKARQAVAA